MPTLWYWHQHLISNPWCLQAQNWSVAAFLVLLALLLVGRSCGWRWKVTGCAVAADRTAALLVLAVAFVVSCWNWPVADDWSWAVEGRRSGGVQLAIDSYRGWTGRYATYAIGVPYGWLFDPVIGSLLWSWLLIAGVVSSAAYALRPRLPATPAGRRLTWTVAVIGSALWMVTMEWPGHGLFWFSATSTYAVALPLALTAIGAAQRAAVRPRTMPILCAMAGAVIGGLGESAAVAVWALVMACCAQAWIKWLPSRWCWSAMLVTISLGLMANAFAPGTAHRAAALAEAGGFASPDAAEQAPPSALLGAWLLRSGADSLAWLSAPPVLAAAIAGIPVAWLLARREAAWETTGIGVLTGWMVVPGVVFAGYLPAFVIVGHAPPWRARDALQGLLLIAAFAAWVRTVGWIRRRGSDPHIVFLLIVGGILTASAIAWLPAPRRDAQTLFLGVLLLGALGAALACRQRWSMVAGRRERRLGGMAFAGALLLLGSFPSLVVDAAATGPRWRTHHGLVAESLSASVGADAVVPPDAWMDRPHHLWYWGIGGDPKTWRNRALADWYGVRSVRTGEPPDVVEDDR